MNEDWKELNIGNLPSDILVGDYELADYDTPRALYLLVSLTVLECLGNMKASINWRYYYRKKAPNPPTHEEIMSKWWRDDMGVWYRVLEYRSNENLYTVKDGDNDGYTNVKAKVFTGLESADIPPESEETGEVL